MFYAHIVLAKKGPLARIWLAAHWDKKLTKAHVFETNIEQSVDGIMQPKVKLALRTSGHLLLGVVRIYSRKAKYLLADCNEAFAKIKVAFRPGIVDLPEEHREAAVNAITLPEVFHDFDTALPELNDVDIEAQFSINQSRADEITMREDYGTLPMSIHDDGFGDMGFDADTPDLARDGIDPNIDENLFGEDLGASSIDHTKEPVPGTSRSMMQDMPQGAMDDGFGEEFGQPAAGLFEGDIFTDAPMAPASIPPVAQQSDSDSDDDMDHFDGGAPSPSSTDFQPPSVMPGVAPGELAGSSPAHRSTSVLQAMSPSALGHLEGEHQLALGPDGMPTGQESEHLDEQGGNLTNEEESFALAPIDATALKGVTKAKRKRKLIVDEVKNISGEEMKNQLANTSDIVTTLDLAPPTKRLMFWKETGGVEKLFALPSRDIPARSLFSNYQRNLVSRGIDLEDFSMLGPAELLALEQQRPEEPEVPVKRGRKRKQVPEVEQPPPPPQIQPPQTPQTPSIPEPEVAREQLSYEQSVGSVNVGRPSECDPSLMPPPPTPSMHHISSPHSGVMGPLTPGLPMTPGGLLMTPGISMTPAGMHGDLGGLDHGGITPHHAIENMESIPNLPADQVSSILNGTAMENMGFTNMGYEGHTTPRAGMSERIANDWNEDYDFPQSVGQLGEEQLENETDEQFEERVLNKRAAQMFVAVKRKLLKSESIQLSEMTYRNSKKQAAQKFYSLLVLKKFQALEITQSEPFGDIAVTKGVMFDNPKL
ncbi:double-strand-break repair protein rad21-like protein 1 isoform X2 [Phlebotomus papatasi]|uniref:double-strand-break repair protein rad21-like protein 1 isoform X2 n=1 Tax=Phlebotomus papatasi TaxID=29031 RepID=UPI002483DF90|nr:double-strand-break repair protein rad21-like protein 1 isoform X2 [Phlebotomus papatasi]